MSRTRGAAPSNPVELTEYPAESPSISEPSPQEDHHSPPEDLPPIFNAPQAQASTEPLTAVATESVHVERARSPTITASHRTSSTRTRTHQPWWQPLRSLWEATKHIGSRLRDGVRFRGALARPTEPRPPKPWRSKSNRSANLVLLLAVGVLIIVALIVLCVLSNKHQGLADVQDKTTQKRGQIQLKLKLTWTFLPTLFFSAYNLWHAAAVRAFAMRQPYVELSKSNGAPANKSILLDYTTYTKFTAWIHAKRRQHRMLAFCLVVELLFGLGMPALAAALFSSNGQILKTFPSVEALTYFNDSGLVPEASLVSMYGTVAATELYGGRKPPWLSDYEVFNAISIPTLTRGGLAQSNLTANTSAYSLEAGCRFIPPDEFELKLDGSEWRMRAKDRGCQLEHRLLGPVGTNNSTREFRTWMQTFSNLGCGLQAGWSRIVVIGAQQPDEDRDLVNQSVISCSASYFSSTGELTLSLDPSGINEPVISKPFRIREKILRDSPRPLFADIFEDRLPQDVTFDSQAQASANAFGRLILGYSQKHRPGSYLRPEAVLNSTKQILGAIFPLMVQQNLVAEVTSNRNVSDNPNQSRGILYQNRQRLVVIQPIAYTLMIFLALTVASTSYIFVSIRTSPIGLYEEPQGLFSAARILRDSDLPGDIERLIEDGNEEASWKTRETWGKSQDLLNSRWKMHDWQNPRQMRLVRLPDMPGTTIRSP